MNYQVCRFPLRMAIQIRRLQIEEIKQILDDHADPYIYGKKLELFQAAIDKMAAAKAQKFASAKQSA